MLKKRIFMVGERIGEETRKIKTKEGQPIEERGENTGQLVKENKKTCQENLHKHSLYINKKI